MASAGPENLSQLGEQQIFAIGRVKNEFNLVKDHGCEEATRLYPLRTMGDTPPMHPLRT